MITFILQKEKRLRNNNVTYPSDSKENESLSLSLLINIWMEIYKVAHPYLAASIKSVFFF